MSGSAGTNPSTASQLARAVRNVLIAAVLLGGVFFVYSQWVDTTAQLKKLREQASALLRRDSPEDYQKAAALIDSGLKLRVTDPWFISARAEAGALLWAEDGETSARADAEHWTQVAEDARINRAERYDAEGLVLLSQGQPDKAESVLIDVVNRRPDLAPVVVDLGIIHEREGKLDLARNDFRQAADRDWRNPRYSALFGESLFNDAQYANAAQAFQKALEANPNHPRSIIGRARSEIALGERLPESTKALDELLADPDSLGPALKLRALAGRAEAQLAAGNPAGAEGSARQALDSKVEGDNGVAYAQYDLGLALAAQKKPGALDAFKQAIDLVGYVPHFYFDGALALAKEGNQAEGLALLDQYAKRITDATGKLKPDDAYHRARGQFMAGAGKLDDALKEYDLAIADNKIGADAYYDKGLVHEEQARASKNKKEKYDLYTKSLGDFDQATEIRERFPEAWRERGMVFLDNGDPQATQSFLKALLYYKATRAPKAITDAFINDVEEHYVKAGKKFKADAASWKKEAPAALTP